MKTKRKDKNKKKTKKIHVIKSTTPVKIKKFMERIPNGRSGGPRIMTYKPDINKVLPTLVSLKAKTISNKECYNELEKKASIRLTYGESTPPIEYPTPKIGIPECVKITDPRAKKILLENTKSKKLIPASKITAPLQYLSNCWFNSGFMVLFISDKGREFNRSFRQSMIEGKIIDKDGSRKEIPEKLRNALGYFAIAIDACLRGDPIMHKLNTNHLLLSIYKSIPKSKMPEEIKSSKIDEAGNPITYYKALYIYLYGNKSGSFPIEYIEISNIPDIPVKKGFYDLTNMVNYYMEKKGTGAPDLFIIEIFNNEEKGDDKSDPSKTVANKPLILKVKDVEYILDSTLVRDTTNSHLCATLTYGGKEYGFDGESLHRMDPFKWKKYLNKDKNWSFKGSVWKSNGLAGKKGSPLHWNYKDGYQVLYYYRIK